ncbi:hypothetical protein [Flavobacterium sp. 9AF]|uniref:hypothetical protein n=1 Tax=Flavobacterium sp. 9AF TaxID=2653142 RepID=UPI00135B4B98|nr:hypothetical protein [Flavobacterium sp. 9AF]
MKNLRNILATLTIMLLISCDKDDAIQNESNLGDLKKTTTTAKTSQVYFDVYIKLVTQSGQEIPASTLPGYGATNLDTGDFYFDSPYEPGLFESLPVGTYRFIARDGYWDGASSAIVEVTPENEEPEGWIYATLRYWSE